MRQLRFDRDSFMDENGSRIFLISGEQHYFRVSRSGWKDRLMKLRDAGANCVATYVPWLLHEPQEGHFDFQSPHLELERWLEACQEVGLWAIVRPGPYQYSELRNGGLPTWLLENYPQVMAQTLDGKPFTTSEFSISYVHPTFLEKTQTWFKEVIPLLARHQTTKGGAISAVQIDNELMGVHEWFGSWDYNRQSMGIGDENGRWPDFLRHRYGDLKTLNQAWSTNVHDWRDALPISPPGDGTLASQRRLKDYNDFYFSVCAEYMVKLGGWMRELGIVVPLMHNSAGPTMNAYFEQIVDSMGSNFIFGSDHYYNLGLDWGDGTHPTPNYASKVFYSLSMLRHFGQPPSVLEMPGGSPNDWPPILAGDLRCAYLTNLAYGMKGYNIYVHAGGENPPGAADLNNAMANYDYNAEISPKGELRELYYTQKGVADFIHENSWLASARRQYDCRIGLAREYARSVQYGLPGKETGISNNQAWTFLRTGLMMTSFNASWSPALADLDSDEFLADLATPLMVPTGDALSAEIQRRLVRFLDLGGKLLLAPTVPCLDENFVSCTILADALNINLISSKPPVWQKPGNTQKMLFHETSGDTIGWELRLASGGAVILLEYMWKAAQRWQERLICKALTRLGGSQIVRCDNPNIWTSLLSDGSHSLLFLMNFLTGPLEARLIWKNPVTGSWVEAGKHAVEPVSVKVITEGI